jgi:hypothetical protein
MIYADGDVYEVKMQNNRANLKMIFDKDLDCLEQLKKKSIQ